MIIREEIPCWYELSWLEEELAIALRIHKNIVEEVKVPEDASIVTWLMKKFGFATFIGNLNKDFGFNSALKLRGTKNDFVELIIKIPIVKKETDEICSNCNGTGKDEFRNGKCLFCYGSGKKYVYDSHLAYAISASFTVLLKMLHLIDRKTSATFPQLLTVTTTTDNDMHGGSLWGKYSIPLCEWLSSVFLKESRAIPEMIKAMKKAHAHMIGMEELYQYSFQAYVANEKGWLNVSCPGDACGLNPSGYICKGEGYEFNCHNVDTPVQQLTLLAGLAALCDKAKEQMLAQNKA